MRYLYSITSINFPVHIDHIDSLKQWLAIHNFGGYVYTKTYCLWKFKMFFSFQGTARRFKIGADRTFVKKRTCI